MDPLLFVLVATAVLSLLAAVAAPGERGEPLDDATHEALRDQLAAWQ